MTEHIKNIAFELVDLIQMKDAQVLDIGCNDGTLLSAYPDKYKKFGVDPSDISGEIDGRFNIIRDFFPSKKLESVIGESTFDIITSIAMFYDLENPVEFARQIKSILSENGVWVLELSYMPSMLEMNAYDTICHEHLEYYSFAVLEKIFSDVELMVFNAYLNNINGGSIRCYVTHKNNLIYCKEEFTASLDKLKQNELKLELNTDKPYKKFKERIETHRNEMHLLIDSIIKEGKRIHVYGASTKGNTILQYCGLDNSVIECAAERNSEKIGARTLGTNIPIVSEAESRLLKPDYYLVLPWHFRDEFLDREREIIENGTAMIFPLPELTIVTKENIDRSR